MYKWLFSRYSIIDDHWRQFIGNAIRLPSLSPPQVRFLRLSCHQGKNPKKQHKSESFNKFFHVEGFKTLSNRYKYTNTCTLNKAVKAGAGMDRMVKNCFLSFESINTIKPFKGFPHATIQDGHVTNKLV